MITKDQMQEIDTAFEECIKKVSPIVSTLNAGVGFGSLPDCYALHGWGLLMQGANSINKGKALAT